VRTRFLTYYEQAVAVARSLKNSPQLLSADSSAGSVTQYVSRPAQAFRVESATINSSARYLLTVTSRTPNGTALVCLLAVLNTSENSLISIVQSKLFTALSDDPTMTRSRLRHSPLLGSPPFRLLFTSQQLAVEQRLLRKRNFSSNQAPLGSERPKTRGVYKFISSAPLLPCSPALFIENYLYWWLLLLTFLQGGLNARCLRKV